MRESIPPSQQLSITLRYLATGNTFEDLKFISAISPQSIGRIAIDTSEAIIHCLNSYIKVRMVYSLLVLLFKMRKSFDTHQNITLYHLLIYLFNVN